MMKRLLSGLGYGGLAGALLTAPLIGLMFLADKLLDLPFAPFALFDWIARVMPGPLVTFGIDLMINSLSLAGLSVAAAAKTAEQIGAILFFFFIGVAVCAVFFVVMKPRQSASPSTSAGTGPGPGVGSGPLAGLRSNPAPGLIIGIIFGLPLTIVSLPMGQSTMNPVVTFIVLMAPVPGLGSGGRPALPPTDRRGPAGGGNPVGSRNG